MAINVNTTGELGRLITAVDGEKPTKADRQALDGYLKEHGETELARIGDLAHHASNAIIETTFAKNYGLGLAIGAHLNELQEALGYAKGSPLEQLLIKHILCTWLRLYDCELRYEVVRKDNPTMEQMEHWEMRLSIAQRRFLRSIEALARVRRLLYKPENKLAFNLLLKQQLKG